MSNLSTLSTFVLLRALPFVVGISGILNASPLDIAGMVPRNPKPPPTHIIEVTKQNGYWITGADGGIISHSEDGQEWSTVAVEYTKGITTITHWNGVYYAGGVDSRRLLRSIDLVNWVEETPANYPGNPRAFVKYGERLFVAGLVPGLSYTDDGESWTTVDIPESNRFTGMASNGSRLVLVGNDGLIMSSDNGLDWTLRQDSIPELSGIDDDFNFVSTANGLFIAGGKQGLLMTSPDGVVWTLVETPFESWQYSAVFQDGTYHFAGRVGIVHTTENFLDWVDISLGTSSTIQGIAGDGENLLAGGRDGFVSLSSDGINWEATTAGTREFINEIEYGADVFVATDASGGIWKSNDSESWISVHEESSGHFVTGLVFDGSQFVAITFTGTLITSPDGEIWTESPGLDGDPQQLRLIGDTFWVVGSSGLVAFSQNLTDWTLLAVGASTLLDIAFGNGTYVVTGRDGALYSSEDGTTWTTQESGHTEHLKTVAFNNGKFIVLGRPNVLLSSENGTAWESLGSNLTPFDASRLEVIDEIFVAPGYLGGVGTSPDGLNWTLYYPRTSQTLFDIVCSDERTVAVGTSGSILSSRLTLVGGYQEWKEARFSPSQQLDAAISGPEGDPDSDGRANAFEFYSNTSPLVANAGPLFDFILHDIEGTLYPGFEVRKRKELSGATLEVWGSTTLSQWDLLNDGGAILESTTPFDEDVDLLRYYWATPLGQSANHLLSLGIRFDE